MAPRSRALLVAPIFVALAATSVVACAQPASAPTPTRAAYAPRPPGCDVAIFRGESPLPVDPIAAVEATCDEALTEDACLRRLQDEVCKVGGDVAWDVLDQSKIDRDALRWSARAGRRRSTAE